MADISDVNVHEIKDLYESLEGLSCEFRCLAMAISHSLSSDDAQLES